MGSARVLWKFLLLSWLLLLANASSYLLGVRLLGAVASGWAVAVWWTYCLLYLLPVFAPLLLIGHALDSVAVARRFPRLARHGHTALVGAAWLGASAVQLLVFADAFVFRLYGFHFNGFVWNLVTTPGGIDSMGASGGSEVSFAAIALGWLLAEAFLLRVAQRSLRFDGLFRRLVPSGAMVAAFAVCVPLLGVGERAVFAVSDLTSYRPVLTAANAFPFYMPVRVPALRETLGLAAAEHSLRARVDTVNVHYPLQPIARAPGHRDWNIVWLVAESLRADMLDPAIMPATSAFAERAANFRSHYSGGNGTRMGMFSMFYGLYGSYWFSFLNEGRGPALLDVLLDGGYQTAIYTSARFTYPEFDKTIFRRIPRAELHEGDDHLAGWQNDRENVGRLLADIDGRDPSRPFFAFMFFESPHAQYYFPEESVIRRPYLESFNYATTDIAANIGLIKNRYINACHHLDSQFERVLTHLREKGLLDSTIVVITGDHGEEFMEKGHWGHHASFVDEQIRVPLVIWAPGQPARVEERMSSHLDIVPTLMTQLGVTNPPADYSLGSDLFGAERPENSVVADWDRLACVSRAGKAILPVNYNAFGANRSLGPDDVELQGAAEASFLASERPQLNAVMKNLARFSR